MTGVGTEQVRVQLFSLWCCWATTNISAAPLAVSKKGWKLMKKKNLKAVTIITVAAILISLFTPAALAEWIEPKQTFIIGDATEFHYDLSATSAERYAGVEFGIKVSPGGAARLVTIEWHNDIAGAVPIDPERDSDGVYYFGFFTDSNILGGEGRQLNVGRLIFDGYTANEPVTVSIVKMTVNRLIRDNLGYWVVNLDDQDRVQENIREIEFRRVADDKEPSTGGNRSPGGVVSIPDTGLPLEHASGERELYGDVADPGAWYFDAVYYATDAGLMQGVGNNLFSPNAPLTRAMFVTILGRLAGQRGEVTAGFSNAFQDVPDGTWFTQYVAWAADKGIVLGHSPTAFAPNDPVTREQMAALMIRFCDYMEIVLIDHVDISFADADSISPWAHTSVMRAASVGLMQGDGGNFRPQATSTRAEVAQLFMNFMEAYW